MPDCARCEPVTPDSIAHLVDGFDEFLIGRGIQPRTRTTVIDRAKSALKRGVVSPDDVDVDDHYSHLTKTARHHTRYALRNLWEYHGDAVMQAYIGNQHEAVV